MLKFVRVLGSRLLSPISKGWSSISYINPVVKFGIQNINKYVYSRYLSEKRFIYWPFLLSIGPIRVIRCIIIIQ